MERLLEILKELHPNVDFETQKSLFDDRILDSFDIVTLVTELSDAFDIELDASDMVPENFNSVDAIWEMVKRRAEG